MRIANYSPNSSLPITTRPAPTKADPTDSFTMSVVKRIDQLEAKARKWRGVGDGLGAFMFLGFPAWATLCFVLGGARGLGVGAAIGFSLLAGSAYAESMSRDYHDQASELKNKKPTPTPTRPPA